MNESHSPDPEPTVTTSTSPPVHGANSEGGAGSEVVPPTPTAAGTERFDELVRVVRPWMKVALLVSGLTIVGALLWATLATITTSTSATAALLPSSGLVGVTSTTPAVLESWNVSPGDTVSAGEALGTQTDFTGRSAAVAAPVTGKVELLLANPGTAFTSGETLALLVPSASERIAVTFLPPSQAEAVAQGQPAVITFPGCAPLSSAVSSVLPLPLTTEQITERTGLPGVVPLIAPESTGTGVQVTVPSDWCSGAKYGVTGTMVITTGSTHPISYLAPGG